MVRAHRPLRDAPRGKPAARPFQLENARAGKPLSSAGALAARKGMGATPGPPLLSSESVTPARVLGGGDRRQRAAWAGGRPIEHLGALAGVTTHGAGSYVADWARPCRMWRGGVPDTKSPWYP